MQTPFPTILITSLPKIEPTIVTHPTIEKLESSNKQHSNVQSKKLIEDNKPLPYTQYRLSVEYEHYTGMLNVHEQIVYTHPSQIPINEIILLVEANRDNKVFYLESFKGSQNTMALENYHLEKERLTIPLQQTLQYGEKIELFFTYKLLLPAKESTLGKGYRQTNLADWYIQIPPYDEENGWLIMPNGLVGEAIVYEVADFYVDIAVGKKAEKVILAACAPAEWKNGKYHYEHLRARNFTWSASTMYETFWFSADSITVMGYVYPNHLKAAKLAAAYIANAIKLYSELFGEYPRKTITFVEADFADGMEYDGLFFLDDYYFANPGSDSRASLASLSVHETAHQWWLIQVSNNQAKEPWLDEALATYSELLFYERYYPEFVDWWWDYRVHQFKPTGYVNDDIYQFNHYRDYINAVYLQGAIYIDNIRKTVGDEPFFAFLRAYVERYSHQLVTEKQFFDLLAEIAAIDKETVQKGFFR